LTSAAGALKHFEKLAVSEDCQLFEGPGDADPDNDHWMMVVHPGSSAVSVVEEVLKLVAQPSPRPHRHPHESEARNALVAGQLLWVQLPALEAERAAAMSPRQAANVCLALVQSSNRQHQMQREGIVLICASTEVGSMVWPWHLS
jgi:hypothetical protein